MGPTTYDAWKEDMAVVNIFFGQNTLKGETTVHDDVNQFQMWYIFHRFKSQSGRKKL